MKKAIMSIIFLAAIAVLGSAMASAIVPNSAPYANGLAYGYGSYGSHPVNPSMYGTFLPYSSQPARIGGFFGANSVFLHGLRAGVYDGPQWNYNTRSYVSSQYYPRAGGWFGYGTYGYNLRPGTFTYTGGTGGYGYQAPTIYGHGIF